MPTWFYEIVVAPIAVAIAFRHAARALGARRAALEMAALAAYGFALEAVSMAVFASHHYSDSWRFAPLGVPVAVAFVWAAIIVAAMAVAWRYGAVSPLARAAAAALTGITLDMMIEPVAARAGLWTWTPPGPWLGVPIGNFVGWAVIVGAYVYGAERWAGEESWSRAIVRRAALATACIVMLLAVGLAWTGFGLERAFADGRGWVVWISVLLATVVSSWGGTSGPVAPSLPARLAAVPGRGPEAVLVVIGLAYAAEAFWIADARVTLVVLGSLATLGAAAVRRQG